jgi:predicted branched-subunit amino acid permease
MAGLGVYIFWNLFTLVGAFGAKALGNPAAWGLDAAVPAAFLGLLWPRLTTNFLRLVAGCSVLFTIVATPLLPAGVAIIATAIVAIVFGWSER